MPTPFRAGIMLLSANKALNGFYHFSGGGDSNKLVVDFSGGMEQGGQALNPDHATDAQDPPAEPETPEEPEEPDTVPVDGETELPEDARPAGRAGAARGAP